jgi:inward rectifier potassium channel
MHPVSFGAHVLTSCETLVGIVLVALCTGLVFSRFSAIRARAKFASAAVIAPMNGSPMLMFRIGHERSTPIVDVMIRVTLSRTELTSEGVRMYRMYDLELERDRAPVLSRAWTVMHRMTPTSPLYGATPHSCATAEIELLLTLHGMDETSGQMVHARHTYEDKHIEWGARHADMLTEQPDKTLLVDLDQFDRTVGTMPNEAFPYPALSVERVGSDRRGISDMP